MKPPAAIAAYVAIGKDGAMDLDLVRRSRAAAQSVATSVHNRAWPHLVAAGWRIEAVTVRVATEVADDDARDAPAPARLGPALDSAPARSLAPSPPAPRPRPGPTRTSTGRMKLLRAGEV